jgi:uncharacterized protein YgbK (DUF1537 family)
MTNILHIDREPVITLDSPRDSRWSDGLAVPRGVSVDAIAARLGDARRVIVLDDDPTGTQTVRDVPILTTWEPPDLAWALEQDGAGFFILTNTRSLSEADAAARIREIAGRCLAVAATAGIPVVFASRGDSTLRGHFPPETDVLSQVSAEHGLPVNGILFSPAYLDAGRITLDGVHWVSSADGLAPVAAGEFARDATFGYRSSVLADWVEEKSNGRISAASVTLVALDKIRSSAAPLTGTLLGVRRGAVVVIDAVDDDDLRSAALSVLEAEAEGARLVYRVGPSFVRARLGQSEHAPIEDADLLRMRGETAVGGLVVVGSHVAQTTRQLQRLAERSRFTAIELDATVVGDGDGDGDLESHVANLAARAGRALETGLVVINTSRLLLTGHDPESSLDISRRISAALVDVVRRTVALRRPRYVIAKGGITSSDIATEALGIERAWVRGSLLPGIVSLWQAASGPSVGLPFIVFAGNVGDDESLAQVVDRLDVS